MESENQVKFYFGIISVMLAFVIITGGFILAVMRYQKRLYIKQQELLRLDAEHKKELLLNSIESAEAERMALAKDIHDEIGSIFSTLSLSINRLDADNLQQGNHLATSKNLIQTGIDSVRRISHAIVPFELEILGLAQTIENYFHTLSAVSQIEIEFNNNAPLEKLTPGASLAIYRIIQELSSNCIKHAGAKKLLLDIHSAKDEIVLRYTDDGAGAVLAETMAKKGIGLRNIESRVLLMDGRVNFVSAPQQGFACSVTIPLINNSIA